MTEDVALLPAKCPAAGRVTGPFQEIHDIVSWTWIIDNGAYNYHTFKECRGWTVLK